MDKKIDTRAIIKIACIGVACLIVWAICLALFNVIVFVTPNEINEVSKFSGGFWASYAFITVAFFLQLACALFVFIRTSLKKSFYNVALISISSGGIIAMLIVGSIFLAIPQIPAWISIILCAIVLACDAVAIVKAITAAGIVSNIDTRVENKTAFIKELTYKASNLVSLASTDELKEEAKRVYEAIRYSDPTSNSSLDEINSAVLNRFYAFKDAVNEESLELAKTRADEFLQTLEARNKQCKLTK